MASNTPGGVFRPTRQTFDEDVMGSDLPVMVEFWSPASPPCRGFMSVVESLAPDLEGRMRVAAVNVDEEPELAGRFGVCTLPSARIVDHGRVIATVNGTMARESLLDRIESSLDHCDL